jgi:multidrug efflux pump subunit AcrB
MGLVIVLLGVFAIATTPTDIFPEIDIPVVSVIWNYGGLSTEEMASRITTYSEYTISSVVSDVRTIESQTYPGVSVIKIYFQPNVNVEAALAQVTAVSQTILRVMPPGAVPPFIVRYNASSVRIIQLALGGKTLSEAELYDYGIYRIRQQIAPIQGITLPLPYGGKPRQVMVDLDPQALLAKTISAADVSAAVNLQNLTLPSGSVKLGPREYPQRAFVGKIANTAGAVDPTSRTLLTEVRLRNEDHALMPGMYAQVKFSIVGAADVWLIPATALIARAAGPQVLSVGDDRTVHYQNVQLGRDLGQSVEVLAGLTGRERLVVNPPDGLKEGARVAGEERGGT